MVYQPCGVRIKDKYRTPKDMFKKTHLKKMDEAPEAPEDVQNVADETGDESLPCAQPRAESTILEP